MLRALAMASAGSAVACIEPPTALSPPDVSEVKAKYARPSASLTAENINETTFVREGMRGVIDRVGGLDALSSNIRDAKRALDEATREYGPREFPLEISIEGHASVTADCPGWGDEDPGSFEVTITFHDNDLIPVIWGSLDDCRFDVSGQAPIALNGELVAILLEDPVFGLNPDVSALLYSFDGETFGGGVARTPLSFDFQVGAQSEVSMSLDLQDGSGNIVYFEDPDIVGYRAANGTHLCDVEERICANSQTNQSIKY